MIPMFNHPAWSEKLTFLQFAETTSRADIFPTLHSIIIFFIFLQLYTIEFMSVIFQLNHDVAIFIGQKCWTISSYI